jgi:hypothetical protein
MNHYLIRASITHHTRIGALEYPLSFPVMRGTMTRAIAARAVIGFLLRGDPPETRKDCLKQLLENGSVFIPHISRSVRDVSWEDLDQPRRGEQPEPIVITISDGSIENIAGIPEGHRVEVRDWDGDGGGVDDNGDPMPAVTVWEHDGQWAPGCS